MSEKNTPLAPCERLLAIPLLELNAHTVATWRLPGLPTGTLDLPECHLVMTGTADLDRFDLAMVKTCTDFNRDVLLIRMLTGECPAEADIVLRSVAEPMLLPRLRPCRIDGSLWFVPPRLGRCVEVQESGLAIHWSAPVTTCDIEAGCERAASEITRFLQGVTF